MEYIYEGYLTLKLKVNGRKFKIEQGKTYDILDCEMETISTTRPDLYPQFVKKNEYKKEEKYTKEIKKYRRRKT